jgi:hypothetical protein
MNEVREQEVDATEGEEGSFWEDAMQVTLVIHLLLFFSR